MKTTINNSNELTKQLEWIRNDLLSHLQELQANFQDLSDEELLECRQTMLNRINECLARLEESYEDNQ
jgi:hypothetical protein